MGPADTSDTSMLKGPTPGKPPYHRVEMKGDGYLDVVEGVRCVIAQKCMRVPEPAQLYRVGRSPITPEHFPAADSRQWARGFAAASPHAPRLKAHCLILVLLLCLGISSGRRRRRRPRQRSAISSQLSFDF